MNLYKIEAQLQILDFEDFAVWCENLNSQNKIIFSCFMHTPISPRLTSCECRAALTLGWKGGETGAGILSPWRMQKVGQKSILAFLA